MQDALENTSNTTSVPQQPGLISTIFREYRNHFGLFWRVMLPVIIVSLAFYSALFLFSKLWISEAQWTFSTSGEITVFSGSTGTNQSSSKPMGVKTTVGFNGSTFGIGFLWFAMCPLAFIIVHQYCGTNATSIKAWQHTRRKIVSILGIWVLFGLLATAGFFTIVIPILTGFSQVLIPYVPVAPSTPILLLMIVGIPAVYFLVKWSLYNQGIIIENLSWIAALRRSSELVRGKWRQFFGMYLLLVWGTMVFTTAVLGLTLLLFSVVAAEFVPLREILLSETFFDLFFGVQVQITLQHTPVWAIAVMVVVNILIDAILAPIWALLTTHLYMERAGTVLKGTVELESVPQVVSG